MGSPHALPSYQGTEKSCLIRFLVTFFISAYKRPVAAGAGCVLNIDLSADPRMEKSLTWWNEAEKQHIKNHQMKRLLCLSELLCVLKPLGVSLFFCEKSSVIHLVHLNQSANKLTHKYRALPSVSSSLCQTRTCNPSAFLQMDYMHLIPRSRLWSLLFLHSTTLLSRLCNNSLQLSNDLPAGFKQKMTYNFQPENK